MTKYYLAARGNHLHQAHRSMDAALKAYLSTHSEDAKRYAAGDLSFEVSLGVSFLNDDINQPVFAIGEVGAFILATCRELKDWADWYALDDVKTLYKLD